jgi:hypothetical protein
MVAARVGGLGVYATSATLTAWRRLPAERAVRTGLTFAGVLVATPLGLLVPPHLEPAALVFIIGLYFTRRAWVGEWQAAELDATCPHCDAALHVRRATMLYLPHTLSCPACRSELWLEVGVAPEVSEAQRRDARTRRTASAIGDLGGRPPMTWSPASSDWRDRPR